MVEAADLWKRDHFTVRYGLCGSRRRCVLRQRQMSPGAVIVGQISGERPSEMRLIEDDHVIKTLPTNGSDQPLDVGIVPRT